MREERSFRSIAADTSYNTVPVPRRYVGCTHRYYDSMIVVVSINRINLSVYLGCFVSWHGPGDAFSLVETFFIPRSVFHSIIAQGRRRQAGGQSSKKHADRSHSTRTCASAIVIARHRVPLFVLSPSGPKSSCFAYTPALLPPSW